MTPERKKSWQCQACRCKVPKTGNLDTPIRSQDYKKTNQPITPLENTTKKNVTIRAKAAKSFNDTTTSDDSCFLGDTIHQEHTENDINAGIKSTFPLEILSEIIIQRLKENNKFIITELQNTIELEINKAITKLKEDIEGKTDFLYKQNDKTTHEIEEINKKIEKLCKENETLKNEINNMKHLPSTPEIKDNENHSKKIVIYGFSENYNESDYELHNRLIEMFYEILHVDLTGYIEETNRIGKYTMKTRPLVMELLSKKMARYIIENSYNFQGTNIYMSEFLNENARKDRKVMREEMLKARKNGQYAVIRNNNLFVDGKRISIREEATRVTTYRGSVKPNDQRTNDAKAPATLHHKLDNNDYSNTKNNYTFRNQRTTF
ncbi:hypothetical protein PYW07_015151 [Mythimna separata]|uniref:Uncharacterized protein n=1 Tax=Mythimna separata TaxID=271217 RepID=A0AAD7YZG9_MYTSE|nr:hypothetical protein PYW07_015151 [Mythimna separata]